MISNLLVLFVFLSFLLLTDYNYQFPQQFNLISKSIYNEATNHSALNKSVDYRDTTFYVNEKKVLNKI